MYGALLLDVFLIYRASAAAVVNYCQWTTLNAYKAIEGYDDARAYFDSMHLFPGDTCSGTSCTIPAANGASTTLQAGYPLIGQSYVCDNAPHYYSGFKGNGDTLAYICTCTGTYPQTLTLAVGNNIASVNCFNSNANDYCGPWPMQQTYCSSGGSVYNDISSQSFSSCSTFISCSSTSCVANSTSDGTNMVVCDGSTSSQGETISGSSGTTSAGTTNTCGKCVTNPALNSDCAAKYGVVYTSSAAAKPAATTQSTASRVNVVGTTSTTAVATIQTSQTESTQSTKSGAMLQKQINSALVLCLCLLFVYRLC